MKQPAARSSGNAHGIGNLCSRKGEPRFSALLLAHVLESGFAQTEEFAMQNGKGVKEREGDDLSSFRLRFSARR